MTMICGEDGYSYDFESDCHRCHADVQASAPTGHIVFQGRMILCPECGNKRCPKASDHTLACTGSNESGQPGSVYQ